MKEHTFMGFEQPVTLPNLPGMFFRSLFTVARNDQAEAGVQTLRAEFTAPAFSVTQLTRYQQAFDGFVSEVPLTLMYCLAQRVHLAQMLGEEFPWPAPDRKSTRLNSSHVKISYAVFCLKKKKDKK